MNYRGAFAPKNEDNLKKLALSSKIILPPSPLKDYLKFFVMTSHRDCHNTTNVKPEMIPGV